MSEAGKDAALRLVRLFARAAENAGVTEDIVSIAAIVFAASVAHAKGMGRDEYLTTCATFFDGEVATA